MIVPNETPSFNPPTRQALPDQLRGLALLGIVFVNMPYLALTHDGLTSALLRTPLDQVLGFLVVALAQGKFYLLFSFLFGYSLTFLLRGRAPGELRHYRRRLAGLAVLGALHATLLFVGDILLSYALLGLALPFFAARSHRTALVGAAVAYGVGVLVLLGLAVFGAAAPGGFVTDAPTLDAAVRAGFLAAAWERLAALPEVLLTLGVLNWSLALSMFLLGLAAGRAGVLARPAEHTRLWRLLLVLALVVGLPGGLASAYLTLFADDPSGRLHVVGVALGFALAPALTGGYVALAALATGSRLLRFTGHAGRMSLTGYLGESALMGAVFAGWGLGLYGRLGFTATALVTLGVWVLLEVLSRLWLARHAYGPAEWLLRCWSRGAWAPLPHRSGPGSVSTVRPRPRS